MTVVREADRYCPSTADSTDRQPQRPPTIEPPWHTLPWPKEDRPACRPEHGYAGVKVPPGRTDLSAVGRTLDLFV